MVVRVDVTENNYTGPLRRYDTNSTAIEMDAPIRSGSSAFTRKEELKEREMLLSKQKHQQTCLKNKRKRKKK